MKKVSIIIPVYNAANTIERCVNSILNNHYSNLEIMLIEDCSMDQSLNLCKQLEREHNNIICLHNERNRGVSYTRNRGLDQASGEYIMFVDSDDWVENNYVEQLVQIMENSNALLAVCGYLNHDEINKRPVEVCRWTGFEGIRKEKIQDAIKEMYEDCLLQELWNKIFVTKCIKEKNIRFDESISFGEDLRFILAYIKECNVQEVYLLNNPLYHYVRENKDSLTQRVGYESIEETLKNLRYIYLIMGLDESKADEMVEQERFKQIELYAYFIMHNAGMKMKEKKRLVYMLDAENGKKLYIKNKLLVYKERIARLVKR